MRRWLARARRLDRRRIDYAIAALFIVVGEFELIAEWQDGSLAVNAVLFAFAYSTIAWRRTAPVPAGAAMLAMWLVSNLLFVEVSTLQTPLVAVLVMAYGMGAYATGRQAVIAPVVLLVGMGAVGASLAVVFTDYVFPLGFTVAAYLAGRGLRTRTRLTEELHEAAAQAQEAHEAEVARAAAEERRRIAREMHDVVAHSVSVMVVQAGGARRILDRDPQRAVEAAARIEEVGRAALTEMRRLLGVLHHGDEEPGRAPQPTLRELDALIARSRAAGLPVTLAVEGSPRALPAGKDLAAYRVVQEALTNAIKHASGAPTSVIVRWEPSALELEIVDTGAGTVVNGNGSGHGLVGMEERMRLYDGSLRAGARPGGGFGVIARLPL